MQRYLTLARRWNHVGVAASRASNFSKNESSDASRDGYTSESAEYNHSKTYSRSGIGRQWKYNVASGDANRCYKFLITTMRSCLTNRVLEKPEVKVEIAEKSFQELKALGKSHTEHYNLLLRNYYVNNHDVNPTEFLIRMKADNCTPNIYTYEILTKIYGNQGNTSNVINLMDHMKLKGLLVPNKLYAAVVTSHSRSGDLKAAEDVIKTLEATGSIAPISVYTSLLCAYAERGMVAEITEMILMMWEKFHHPQVVHKDVFDTLSRHGHGQQVLDILELIKTKGWTIPDLRELCDMCLYRGEIEAPLIFLSYLSSTDPNIEDLIARYCIQAIHNGLTLQESLERVKQHISTEPYPWLVQNIVNGVMFINYEDIKHSQSNGSFPSKGLLGPHPLGRNWYLVAREALRMLGTVKKLNDFHFYPLLAHQCSEGDIKELIKTFYQLLGARTDVQSNVLLYISMTFTNANISIEKYLSSQQCQDDSDPQWLRELLIFQSTYGRWEEATRTLKKMDVEDIPSFKELDYALMLYQRTNSIDNTAIEFMSSLAKFPGASSSVVARFFLTKGKPDHERIDMLMKQDEEFSLDSVILGCKKKWDNRDNIDIDTLWEVLAQFRYRVPAGDTIPSILYDFAIRRWSPTPAGKKRAKLFYSLLSEEKKEDFYIKCLHVVHLTNIEKEHAALDEFKFLLNMDQENKWILILTWKSAVCAAYKIRAEYGDELLEKMKKNNIYPDSNMLLDLLNIHIQHKDEARCERTLQSVRRNAKFLFARKKKLDVETILSFQALAYFWAELGNLDKILKLEAQKWISIRTALEAKVVAMIHKNDFDKALETLMQLRDIRLVFVKLMLKAVVFNEHPINEWCEHLIKTGKVSKSAVDSMLLFIYLDYGLIDRAKSLYDTMEEIYPPELNSRMRSEQARYYQDIITSWENQIAQADDVHEDVQSFEGVCEEQDPMELQDPGVLQEENLEWKSGFPREESNNKHIQ